MDKSVAYFLGHPIDTACGCSFEDEASVENTKLKNWRSHPRLMVDLIHHWHQLVSVSTTMLHPAEATGLHQLSRMHLRFSILANLNFGCHCSAASG